MEFVDRNGKIFHLNDKRAPNVYAFEHAMIPSPGVCTKAVVKLHPVTADEEGVLVPFADFDEAVDLRPRSEPAAHRAGPRRARRPLHLDLHVAVAGALRQDQARPAGCPGHQVPGAWRSSTPTAAARSRKMAGSVIDGALFRTLMLGLPRLADTNSSISSAPMKGDSPPYEFLCRPGDAARRRGRPPALAGDDRRVGGRGSPGFLHAALCPARDDGHGLAQHVPDRQRPHVEAQAHVRLPHLRAARQDRGHQAHHRRVRPDRRSSPDSTTTTAS